MCPAACCPSLLLVSQTPWVCAHAHVLSLSLLSSISALATAISPVVHFSASERQQMLTAAAVTLAAGHSTGHRGGQSSSRV